MSKYADMAKGKLSSGREKASDFKGRAKGKVTRHIPGRGHKEEDNAPSHVAAPLSSLRDPNSFAPPPRRTGSALAPPPPPSTAKRSVVPAPSKYQDPHAPRVEPPPRFADERQLQAYEEEAEAAHPTSSGPYRVNTTGLSTDHLPPPPIRRDGPSNRSPPSYDSVVGATNHDAKAPSLPPRLPPRSASGTPDRADSPLSTLGVSSSNLNQGAVNRLGAAGISVPAFGIGSSSSPSNADDEVPPPKPPRPGAAPPPSQLNELQNRFARLGTSNTGSSTGPVTPPSEATTWAQKQAAIRPAVAVPVPAPAPVPSPTASPGLAGKKKPPPPPPKKKPTLSAAAAAPPGDGGAPPPIPMSTRPAF
ncbi:hypothetical protein TARUN_6624 [Trichoderma arundinaceum]|uniref:Uncharacterized protein n=1 Tax=Trichoderma arundinaceum TaxID=490622 RepID=A0A395NIL1_TRIAR|nr:hypothetical protein TARUN_6624 [Trichoderma arundinaceum]